MSRHKPSNPRLHEDSLIHEIDREREPLPCPRCGYKTFVIVANQVICNQCGATVAIDRSPIASRAARRKADAVGWKPGGQS